MKRKKGIVPPKRRTGGGRLGDLARLLLLRPLAFLIRSPATRKTALIAILLVSGIFSVEWIASMARGFSCFLVYPEAIRCLGRPGWLASSDRITSDVVGQIQAAFRLFPPESIFEEYLEQSLLRSPGSFSPWIESVEQFERIYPSRFRIALKLRRPEARFSWKGDSYLIDTHGVLISRAERLDRGEIMTAVPLITGFGPPGPLEPATALLNRRLLEGAAVAREIDIFEAAKLPDALKVVEIDVSGLGAGKPDDVVLITNNGIRILWGRSGLDPRFKGIDPTPSKKFEKLKNLLQKRPGLMGIAEVNLAFKDADTTVRLREGGY